LLPLNAFGLRVVKPAKVTFPYVAVVSVIGWVMVAAGVVGEFRFDDKVNEFDATLQKIDNESLARINLEAGEANERAGNAIERAAQLGINLEAERQKTARDEAAILATEKNLADELGAQKQTASDAAAQLEVERKKRVDLAASLLPRHFADQSGVVTRLRAFAPMHVIFEFVSEREPRAIAEEINFVIGVNRWPAAYRRKVSSEDLIQDGVTISPGRKFRPPPRSVTFVQPDLAVQQYIESFRNQQSNGTAVAETIRDGLHKSGIDAEIGISGDLDPDVLLIQVGVKPNHALEATLQELGPPVKDTPLGGTGPRMSGNRASIPDEIVPEKAAKP